MKQPRVPEYREADSVKVYIKTLILFLKDFSMASWTANNCRKREIEELGKRKAEDSEKFEGRTWAQAMLELHPVGSIYMSFDSTSPAQLFGGTWERLENRFLLGAGGSYAVGETGGEENHTLTDGEMPRHQHDERLMIEGYSGWDSYTTTTYNILFTRNKREYGIQFNAGGETFNAASVSANVPTTYTGDGASHNNMPPYIAVYMWKRVS